MKTLAQHQWSERLRSIVGPKGWDYAVFWHLRDDSRSLDWVGCCCSGAEEEENGATTAPNNLLATSSSSRRYMEAGVCPDVKVLHSPTHICALLANMPSSVSLDSGIQGRVFLGGQPKWIHLEPSTEVPVQTKVCIPVQSGLVELGVANHVTENAPLVQYVRARCGDPWQAGTSKVNIGNGLDSGSGQGMMDQQAVKLYYSHPSPAMSSRHYPLDGSVPWASSHPWDQEGTFLDAHLMGGGSSIPEKSSGASMGNRDHQSLEGGNIVDPLLRCDTAIEHDLMQQLPGPLVTHSLNHATGVAMAESPRGSGLSKDDGDVKQEMRGDSSDCSDPMDDDDEKGGPRSARRHLSKNLVAERKRRKKLNERLYSLRALVPKITKMDRASILGDAIEYVKELQQQVKELQDELLLDGKDEEDGPGGVPSTSIEDQLAAAGTMGEEGKAGADHEAARCSTKADQVIVDALDRKSDELPQPMQVEVNKMDGRLFSLRIFCEKRPGVFVKLMQALDALGLDVVHANITTFRGLVLNVFNAEIRDKELMRAEQVRETLLEMTSSNVQPSLLMRPATSCSQILDSSSDLVPLQHGLALSGHEREGN
ncbi:unnamed protein product [Sphagnum balticum]